MSEAQTQAKLFAAFVKAQAQFAHAKKDKNNPHFGSAYADLADVIDAVRPVLASNGLGYLQDVKTDETGVTCTTSLIHETGERLAFAPYWLPVPQKTAQAYGSATTYARRYSLQAALGISAEKDDDGNAASEAPQPKKGLAAIPKSAPAPAPKKEAPQPTGVQIRFGKHKGKAATELTDAELSAHIDYVRANLGDPDERYYAANQSYLAALEDVAQHRGAA